MAETKKFIAACTCMATHAGTIEVPADHTLAQVDLYFRENIPQYTVLKVKKRSYHPDDSHLYMVSAKKGDGTYAVWTCWNDSTKSLNHGHYGLRNEADCERIMEEFYYNEAPL